MDQSCHVIETSGQDAQLSPSYYSAITPKSRFFTHFLSQVKQVSLKCIIHFFINPTAGKPVTPRIFPENLRSIRSAITIGGGGPIFHYILIRIGPKIAFTKKKLKSG